MVLTRRSIVTVVLVIAVGCIPYGDAWFHFGGRVVDGSGSPVADAKLELFTNGHLAGDASVERSDASGEYAFFEHSCPCDFAFELRVSKQGYDTYVLRLRGREANALRKLDVVLSARSRTAP